MEKLTLAVTKILVTEIFQNYSELDMVIQDNASNWLWTVDSSMLVCNMLVNVGLATQLANTARDQTKSAICHAKRTKPELVVPDGETVCLN